MACRATNERKEDRVDDLLDHGVGHRLERHEELFLQQRVRNRCDAIGHERGMDLASRHRAIEGQPLASEHGGPVRLLVPTQLRSGAMIEMEAGIACVEAIHAARIRAAFNELGVKIPVVPNPVLNASSRTDWMLKV
jgi:hypothetical protein